MIAAGLAILAAAAWAMRRVDDGRGPDPAERTSAPPARVMILGCAGKVIVS